ncbi:hypothetical protein LZ32DRAFT_597767 [Colletotrichum eremochloae]|nr:hypothetical protein LZ32DRAFT_597767 [Colletotrichum eremochloae]
MSPPMKGGGVIMLLGFAGSLMFRSRLSSRKYCITNMPRSVSTLYGVASSIVM